MPIFVHPASQQTIIYSSTAYSKYTYLKKILFNEYFSIVYVIPPMFNAYGRIFSVGELIASGYASFTSSGFGMTTPIDIAALFHSGSSK